MSYRGRITQESRQPDLYANREPHDTAVDRRRCEWAVHVTPIQVRQCQRWVRERINGHYYCHLHGKMVRP
jgi:hypothetical protein